MSEQNYSTNDVYEETFFIVPRHIMKLEGLTFAFLKVYETIFQFWNKGRPCFLGNEAIQKRTNLGQAQAREALSFFEKHNVLERKWINGKRFLVQPQNIIETDSKSFDGAGESAPPCRRIGTPPAGESAHNIKKGINKEINKKSVIKRAREADQNPTKNTGEKEMNNDWYNHTGLYEGTGLQTMDHNLSTTVHNRALMHQLNPDDYPWFKRFWDLYTRQDDEIRTLTQWVHDGCEQIGEMIVNDLSVRIRKDKDFQEGCEPNSTNYIRKKKWRTKVFEGKKTKGHFDYEDTSWINKRDIFDD